VAISEQTSVQQFSIPFETLGVARDGVARCMGYADGVLPEPFGEEVDALIEEAVHHAQIAAGFRVFPPDAVKVERGGVHIEDAYFSTDRVISSPLRKAESVSLFVATAGPGMTQWSTALMKSRQQVQGYFVDALGSETVERAADWIEDKVVQWALTQGQTTSNRYSPGYCNWSVEEQHKLFALLPKEFCGVRLTDTALMQPTKSVSGIIGMGKNLKKGPYACSICSMENCFRRHSPRPNSGHGHGPA